MVIYPLNIIYVNGNIKKLQNNKSKKLSQKKIIQKFEINYGYINFCLVSKQGNTTFILYLSCVNVVYIF